MKIKKSLAGGVLVLAVSGGAVAIATSMATANPPAPTSRPGTAATTDAPSIGVVGRTGDKPPAGVAVEKAQRAVELGAGGQEGDRPPAGVTVEKGQAAKPAK
jgi:hypothetical protein